MIFHSYEGLQNLDVCPPHESRKGLLVWTTVDLAAEMLTSNLSGDPQRRLACISCTTPKLRCYHPHRFPGLGQFKSFSPLPSVHFPDAPPTPVMLATRSLSERLYAY